MHVKHFTDVVVIVPFILLTVISVLVKPYASAESKATTTVSGTNSLFSVSSSSSRQKRAPGWGKRFSQDLELSDEAVASLEALRNSEVFRDVGDSESFSDYTSSPGEKRAPGWGKRAPGWGKRAPGWGKRACEDEECFIVSSDGKSAYRLFSKLYNADPDESEFEMDKRAPGWGKRAPGWGKRAPGWGKRACNDGECFIFSSGGQSPSSSSSDNMGIEENNNDMDKRAPGWGKRAPGWGKRAPGWGKRAPGWGKRAPGWGKRSSGRERQIEEAEQALKLWNNRKDADAEFNGNLDGIRELLSRIEALPTFLSEDALSSDKRAPGWGKRSNQNYFHYARLQTDKRAPGWGKRAPGWGKRAPGWGKRNSESDIDSDEENYDVERRAPGWGKRAPGWGKRSYYFDDNLDEDKRAPGWGKRDFGRIRRAPGWGKRSVQRNCQEVQDWKGDYSAQKPEDSLMSSIQDGKTQQ